MLEQFQEKCAAVFRRELRKKQNEIEHFRDSKKSGGALDEGVSFQKDGAHPHLILAHRGSALQVGIDMGTASGGTSAQLDIEELLATRLLVQGNSGSGKSHLLRRLLEQSAQWVQQVIIDPEGDFVTLADKFGHVVVDGERTEAELAGIANRIRQHRVSCVLTLEGLDIEQQMRAAAAFLNGMFDADREFWYPVLVVVDEAQMFAPSVVWMSSGEIIAILPAEASMC